MTVSASSTAGSHMVRRRSSARASVPEEEQRQRQRDHERVLARERARERAAHDVEVERHGRVAAVLEEHEGGGGDREQRRGGTGHADAAGEHVGADREAATGPSAVTSLNATLYGRTTSRMTMSTRREREVELPGGEPRVEVVRPTRDPPRQEVVDQEVGEPDVRAGVTAGDGRVAQDAASGPSCTNT